MIRNILFLLLCSFFGLYAGERSPRMTQTINEFWTFNYFPQEYPDTTFKAMDFDDSQWPAVAIPHTWQVFETTGDVHPFIASASERDDPYWWHGWGWYRKHFQVPATVSDKKIFVEFDGVQKICEVWLNGEKIGAHQGGFTSFYFDITDVVRFDQDNVLAVAVSNRRMDPYRTPPMTAGNWNVYGGIYRDVRLVIKDKVYIPFQGSYKHEGGTFITTPVVTDTSGQVHIQTWIKNETQDSCTIRLVSTLYDSSDQIVDQMISSQTVRQNALARWVQKTKLIDSPHLWSTENPYVYKVISQVYMDDRLCDQISSPLGFRRIRWNYEDNRLYLNGEPLHTHGTCYIPDYPWLGEAMPRWMILKDLTDIRYHLNHNAIRPHVATAAPYVYDWCDRHGLLAVEEVPNFKRIDFSETIQKQMTLEMIRRDRNHPSIFMWSVGNETSDASDTKWVIEEDTTRIIHARNVYNESAGDYVEHTGANMNLENLLRCTVRGWTHSDVMDLAPEINQHTGHEEHQHRMARIWDKSQRGRIDMVSGLMFCYSDYGCDREYKDNPIKHFNPKGWVDHYRIPKYMYYLYQANYADEPMVFAHPHYWKKEYIGTKQDIVIDSNCEQVELFVNGKSFGKKYPSWQNFFTVTFRHIPIKQGTLKVLGSTLDTGTMVQHVVPMTGEPQRITLTTSHQQIQASLSSVVTIQADIVDDQGHHIYGANPPLDWQVKGPATLVGPDRYESQREQHEQMFGTMYIDVPVSNVIRSTGQPGKIIISVTSDGLHEGSVEIEAVGYKQALTRVIHEPPLTLANRGKVKRDPEYESGTMVNRDLLQKTDRDLILHGEGEDLEWKLSQILQERNPELDPRSPEFATFHRELSRILEANDGIVVADDYNFLVEQINRSAEN